MPRVCEAAIGTYVVTGHSWQGGVAEEDTIRAASAASILAIASGLLTVAPGQSTAFAEDPAGVPPREVGEIVVSDDGGVVRGDELVDERTEYSRTFETSLPGVFATDVSTGPLHYQDQRATGPASTRG